MSTSRHEHDFDSPGTPTRFYAICTVPRSGSTLLARMLWRTGLMGAPSEYFSLDTEILQLQKIFLCDSMGEYTDEVLRRRTSPNGVFGMKLFFPHWHIFRHSGRFRRFRDLKLIHLQRRDRIEQAVSFRLAMQTDRWWADNPAKAEPRYDFNELMSSLRDIDFQERGWAQLFSGLKVRPMTVVYEDFCADMDRQLEAILRYAGVDPGEPATPVTLPAPKRQFSEINTEWAERFRADYARWRKGNRRDGAVPA